eukprot:scpid88349/ scgid19827/ 
MGKPRTTPISRLAPSGGSPALRPNAKKNSRSATTSARANSVIPSTCPKGRTLAGAFDYLSSLLPCYPPNKKMTKIETLRLAMLYIGDLSEVVQGFQETPEAGGETGQESDNALSPSADISLQTPTSSTISQGSGNSCASERCILDGISERSKATSPSIRSSLSRTSLLESTVRPRSVASPTNSDVSMAARSPMSLGSSSNTVKQPQCQPRTISPLRHDVLPAQVASPVHPQQAYQQQPQHLQHQSMQQPSHCQTRLQQAPLRSQCSATDTLAWPVTSQQNHDQCTIFPFATTQPSLYSPSGLGVRFDSAFPQTSSSHSAATTAA